MKLIYFSFIRLGGVVIFTLFSSQLILKETVKWYMMVVPF